MFGYSLIKTKKLEQLCESSSQLATRCINAERLNDILISCFNAVGRNLKDGESTKA